jgi:hypothetical protein
VIYDITFPFCFNGRDFIASAKMPHSYLSIILDCRSPESINGSVLCPHVLILIKGADNHTALTLVLPVFGSRPLYTIVDDEYYKAHARLV